MERRSNPFVGRTAPMRQHDSSDFALHVIENVACCLACLIDEEVQVLEFLQAGYPLAARWNKPRTFGLNVSYTW